VKARTVPEYLEVLYQSLDLREAARLRVVAEVRDHLTEAIAAAVAAGAEPRRAEEAALRAFGDPVVLAASFAPGPWRSFLRRSRELRRSLDLWHARHVVVGVALCLIPLGGLLLLAQSWFAWMTPFYAVQQLWLAGRIARRGEIGYAARLREFWNEHPRLNHLYTVSFMIPIVFYLTVPLSQAPTRFPWNVLVFPCALLLSWLFFSSRIGPDTQRVAVDE
jgi:hypothetical protein